mmetsp:Transcript_31104/g.64896  ORF Transcript_31104/g.64896 Transcript_31104/m.64896 type:complete len:90 (+) Transcript_31104:1522-1791(+)
MMLFLKYWADITQALLKVTEETLLTPLLEGSVPKPPYNSCPRAYLSYPIFFSTKEGPMHKRKHTEETYKVFSLKYPSRIETSIRPLFKI